MILAADRAWANMPIGFVRRGIFRSVRSGTFVVRILFQTSLRNENQGRQWNKFFSRHRTARCSATMHLSRHVLNLAMDSFDLSAPEMKWPHLRGLRDGNVPVSVQRCGVRERCSVGPVGPARFVATPLSSARFPSSIIRPSCLPCNPHPFRLIRDDSYEPVSSVSRNVAGVGSA